ncbi:MAG: S1 family peptidase [Myxococcota bacterium]|nr:S1 family peptidase [Myxococcota bacterium]
MNNQHWFIRNSLRSVMAAFLLAAAAGCGSTDGGHGDDLVAPSESLAEPFTPVTNAKGDTLCGKQSLGVDDGIAGVDREIYNFERVNEDIARYPEIAEATGISEVTDCESARAYSAEYLKFAMANPSFRGGPSKDESIREFLSQPGSVGEPNPAGPEIEKVFGGIPGNRRSIVKIATVINLNNEYQMCSAVRISETIFLTAAHCLADPTEAGFQNMEVHIKRKKANGTESWIGGGNGGKPLLVYAIRHPDYVGPGYAEYDLAMFWVNKIYQPLLKAELEASATTLIAPRDPAVNDGQLVYGWGPQSDTEDDKLTRLRTPGPTEPTLKGIDVAGPHMWAIHDTGPAFRMCRGDSGGGALRDGMLDGVTAALMPPPTTGKKCSSSGSDMYWTRIDDKMNWLRQQMSKVQDSVTNPFKCVFHSGNSADPNDWDHIVSYIDCTEK